MTASSASRQTKAITHLWILLNVRFQAILDMQQFDPHLGLA
jgi:hypothetical protein